MGGDDLIAAVLKRMGERGTRQRQLASATGLSQAHLSKVLQGRVKLAGKTRGLLSAWIDGGGETASSAPSGELLALTGRLQVLPPQTLMQFMQIIGLLLDVAGLGKDAGGPSSAP